MTQDEIEARGEFTPRTQGEIDRNLFAARTGALVTLSAPATWELLHAAQAWHRHVRAEAKRAPCGFCLGTGKNVMHGHQCYHCAGTGVSPEVLIAAPKPIAWTNKKELDFLAEHLRENAANAARAMWASRDAHHPIPLYPSPLGPQARDTETCAPTAQARDTTPSEEA